MPILSRLKAQVRNFKELQFQKNDRKTAGTLGRQRETAMNKKTTADNKTGTKKLRLEKVDYKNFVSLCRLKVKKNQEDFVAPNVFSLAEAYAAGKAGLYPQPFGIFLGDKPVGFLMIGYYPDLEFAGKWADEDEDTPYFMGRSYLIWFFMIVPFLLCHLTGGR